MNAKEYKGLQAEFISFGGNNVLTGEPPYPDAYSGCYVGTVEVYSTYESGERVPWGQCVYYDEEDIIFNWGPYGPRIPSFP